MGAPRSAQTPGVLYYEPNLAVAEPVIAALRLSGCFVLHSDEPDTIVQYFRSHGPTGTQQIDVAILDAAFEPQTTTELLQTLVKLPGAVELPGLLLVDPSNPTPIAAASELPTLVRPFSPLALLYRLQHLLASPAPQKNQTPRPLFIRTLTQQLREAMLPDGTLAVAPEVLADQLLRHHLLGPPLGACLSAHLGDMPFECLLHALVAINATGRLVVNHEEIVIELQCLRGRVVAMVAQGLPGDLQLLRFLGAVKALPQEGLHAIQEAVGRADDAVAEQCLRLNLISEGELAECRKRQIAAVICEIMGFRAGHGWFLPELEAHPGVEWGAGIALSELVLIALRHLDELALVQTVTGEMSVTVERVDARIRQAGRQSFSSEELRVLDHVNGSNSLKTIARETAMTHFNVARIAGRLLRAGYIRSRQPSALYDP